MNNYTDRVARNDVLAEQASAESLERPAQVRQDYNAARAVEKKKP